ncbi:MAG: cation diffusion facilitator family transporter [Saccharofermentans sp.]|nr:cation diffusion facilitator family transporter [Saccharofermentans sp.]
MENVTGDSRNKIIVRTSIIGIAANLLLAGFKAVVGLLSGSIAIVLDAVNNTSDAASSLITIIGTKLAGKDPDRKHPYGHGRVEYLSAMIISAIVLYAGITSLIESIKKIITPVTPDYTKVSIVIVSVAIVVKIVLGTFVKKTGEKVNSDSLVNSGKDALLDSIISASTLIAAVIFLIWNLSLEAWLGAIISIVIIKSGIDMLRETISQLLGERAEGELIRKIKACVNSFPEVSGAYDLVLHNYGPDNYNGSIHIEISDKLTATQIDELTRAITYKVYEETGIAMTAIGIYSVAASDSKSGQMLVKIKERVLKIDNVIQIHGFYVNETDKTIRFDAVVSFDAKDRRAVVEQICKEVKELYPEYTPTVFPDIDFSDT